MSETESEKKKERIYLSFLWNSDLSSKVPPVLERRRNIGSTLAEWNIPRREEESQRWTIEVLTKSSHLRSQHTPHTHTKMPPERKSAKDLRDASLEEFLDRVRNPVYVLDFQIRYTNNVLRSLLRLASVSRGFLFIFLFFSFHVSLHSIAAPCAYGVPLPLAPLLEMPPGAIFFSPFSESRITSAMLYTSSSHASDPLGQTEYANPS